MNLRRPLFTDRCARRWCWPLTLTGPIRQLFYRQYTRSDSYFSNGELAARPAPAPTSWPCSTR